MTKPSALTEWVGPLYDLPAVLPDLAWAGHIPFLQLLIHISRPRRFVELGVFSGTSFLAGCEAARRYGTQTECVGIDTWRGDAQLGFYQGDNLFRNLSSMVGDRYSGCRLIRSTFDDSVVEFDDGSIDLLHIDGLHTYEAVRHDFETWRPKLAPKSVVLFHDTAMRHGDFGVWKLWASLREEYSGFEFLHSHGLGVLAVGEHSGTPLGEILTFAENPKNLELLRILCETAGATMPGRMERHRQAGRQDVEIPRPASPAREGKPGRNDPCPCGSGRKFKHCHGG